MSHFHADLEGKPRKRTWFPVTKTGLRYVAKPESEAGQFSVCLGEPVAHDVLRRYKTLGQRLGRLWLLRLVQPFCSFTLNIDWVIDIKMEELTEGFHGYAGYKFTITQTR